MAPIIGALDHCHLPLHQADADAEPTLRHAEAQLRKMREALLEGVAHSDLEESAVLFDLIAQRLWAQTKHKEPPA